MYNGICSCNNCFERLNTAGMQQNEIPHPSFSFIDSPSERNPKSFPNTGPLINSLNFLFHSSVQVEFLLNQQQVFSVPSVCVFCGSFVFICKVRLVCLTKLKPFTMELFCSKRTLPFNNTLPIEIIMSL